jgi:hypothetical protein
VKKERNRAPQRKAERSKRFCSEGKVRDIDGITRVQVGQRFEPMRAARNWRWITGHGMRRCCDASTPCLEVNNIGQSVRESIRQRSSMSQVVIRKRCTWAAWQWPPVLDKLTTKVLHGVLRRQCHQRWLSKGGPTQRVEGIHCSGEHKSK